MNLKYFIIKFTIDFKNNQNGQLEKIKNIHVNQNESKTIKIGENIIAATCGIITIVVASTILLAMFLIKRFVWMFNVY